MYSDPEELRNLAYDTGYQDILNKLRSELTAWLIETKDAWRCLPAGELVGNSCDRLDNGEQN